MTKLIRCWDENMDTENTDTMSSDEEFPSFMPLLQCRIQKPQTDKTETLESQVLTPSIVDSVPVNVDSDTGTPTITFRPSCMERRERRSMLSLPSSSSTNAPCPSTYRSYVQLFEPEVVTIEESDDELDKTLPKDNDVSLEELLLKLQSQIDMEKISKFNIARNQVLDGARRAIHRKSFNPKTRISVKFTDDIGVAEGAVDEGGPKREFLRMLMRSIQFLHIFEGPVNKRVLTYNASAMEDKLYRDVGIFFALSLVHGGPPPKFMSTTLYNALAMRTGKCEATIDDISDGDLKAEVLKLKDASMEDLNEHMNSMSTLLITAGCFRPIFNVQQKEKLITDVVRFLVVERVSAPIQQIQEGLQTLGILSTIKEHPQTFKDLFVCQGNDKLTAEIMEVVFMDIKMSVPGCNKRRDEERVVGYWRDFLIDLQEAEIDVITLVDVLSFATGADCVPPLGFDPLPSIVFLHDRSEQFPKANTCSMELKLPISNDYDAFKENMTFGIANSPGFGLA